MKYFGQRMTAKDWANTEWDWPRKKKKSIQDYNLLESKTKLKETLGHLYKNPQFQWLFKDSWRYWFSSDFLKADRWRGGREKWKRKERMDTDKSNKTDFQSKKCLKPNSFNIARFLTKPCTITGDEIAFLQNKQKRNCHPFRNRNTFLSEQVIFN